MSTVSASYRQSDLTVTVGPGSPGEVVGPTSLAVTPCCGWSSLPRHRPRAERPVRKRSGSPRHRTIRGGCGRGRPRPVVCGSRSPGASDATVAAPSGDGCVHRLAGHGDTIPACAHGAHVTCPGRARRQAVSPRWPLDQLLRPVRSPVTPPYGGPRRAVVLSPSGTITTRQDPATRVTGFRVIRRERLATSEQISAIRRVGS